MNPRFLSSKHLVVPDTQTLWGDLKPGEEQVRAIHLAAKSKVMCLTGSPGTGKTASLQALIKLYQANSLEVICLAPTGKAARRMTELTGHDASTIHRVVLPLLKTRGKLDAGVVTIDESSMLDAKLTADLLAVIHPDTRLLFIGDVDQLPSIGPGSVLGDIIDSGVVPVMRLTQIYRQASESRIPYVARDINQRRHPDLKVKGTDVSHIEIAAAKKDDDIARAQQLANIQQMVIHMITKVLPNSKWKFTPQDIQIVCAQHNQAIGVKEMNMVMQSVVNPPNNRLSLGIGNDYQVYVNDRVIHKENNYQLGVMNGEVGIVTELDKKGLVVTYPDKVVSYTQSDPWELHLAYAITVHSSQGSGFPAVIMPVHSAHQWMMTRKLVYTALTRAEKFCIFVGEASAIHKAIASKRDEGRRSSLRERLEEGAVRLRRPSVVIENIDDVDVGSVCTKNDEVTIDMSSLTSYFATEGINNETVTTTMTTPIFTEAAPLPPRPFVLVGYYTIRFTDGRGCLDIRVRTIEKGLTAGKIAIEVMDPTIKDWKRVAFGGARITLFKTYRDDALLIDAMRLLSADPEKCAREYAMNTGRCYSCDRKLTTPESVSRGRGPECSKRVGY